VSTANPSNFARRLMLLLVFTSLLISTRGPAQQQYQGVCAQIKMVISQQLTLERVGFLATLQITDNDGTDPITDFAANLTFENALLSSSGATNDSSSLFFVQPPTVQNIQSINGGGVIGPSQTATISWFIIPKTNAAGTDPNGIKFQVGANLSGKFRGVELPATTLQVFPATITVQPEAQLQISYFTPRDVTADDPFTPQVESPIPFTFGVLVKNVGYGAARKVIINSQQPKITDNKQNLLIVAQLLGSRVNDSALSNANLTVNLGDLQPGQATKGAWDMITSLSGTFVAVNASFTHSSALGGAETSLIQSVNAYLFLHEVINDQPGRDQVKDFLADTTGAIDAVQNLVPDSIYESQGNILPVNLLTNAVVGGGGNSFPVNLVANVAGWGYLRLNDPGQAKLPIASVVRSDGKVLNTNNYWTSIHYEKVGNIKDTYLHIVDLVALGPYTYTVTYGSVAVDTTPPTTTLNFAGPVTFTGGKYYITPATQMYFISDDQSPVSIYYSLTNGPFQPAFPFSLASAGEYSIQYYAKDSANNQETNHSATLVVAGGSSLGFAGISVPSQPLFVPGDALSVRPGNLPISFQALPVPTQVDAKVDIFQGVAAWATLAGAPSSPSVMTSASLTVGGDNVDFYLYKLNSGAWSAEQPVAAPLNLSSLAAGTNTVSVLGRSAHGGYLDSSNAVAVQWLIDPTAPPATITGTPATPSRMDSGLLTVGGANVTHYRWTINNGFYRVETNVAAPLLLTNLTGAQQVVGVLGKANGVYQPTNVPTTVSWTINSLYGYDLHSLTQVRSVTLTNIGGGLQTFNWDGHSDTAVVLPPGWYTVRLTLTDTLGHTNFATRLAQIGELSGTNLVLADVIRGPKHPHARGRWAVWQDQSDGTSQIYAQDVSTNSSPVVKVTTGVLSQENPRTDGGYVAWQSRQANGNWEVLVKDLNNPASAPVTVTHTLQQDEINPAIDWPWVVYQTRKTGDSAAPWQLKALNLANSQTLTPSTSTQDELDPEVQAGRVVWQDFRDVGQGEIYLCELENGATVRRLTTNTFGQYHPVIYNHWIVWQDNRNIEVDLYGFDLLRNREVRITSTAENETRPYLDGPWLVCAEDSLGPQTGNARLIHLPSLRAVPVTRSLSLKDLPALAGGRAIWQETASNQSSIVAVDLPALQPVFQNRNAVAVTDAMVAYAQNAYGLLNAWKSNGVQEITRYTALVPAVTSQTAGLTNATPSGVNFNLVSGTFLWVKFDSQRVLDLGVNNNAPLNLATGANVFGYPRFPGSYHAFRLLRQLGLNNVRGVRMLDAESGTWVVAEVRNGVPVGNDFAIPSVAVLMVDMVNPVHQFTPQ
jgi:beta propeller repeat protein